MRGDRAGVALWSLLAVPALAVAGSSLLVLPATLIGLGGIGLALHGLRRSPDSAAMPLGVALAATTVVALAAVISGDVAVTLSGVVAVAFLGLAHARLLRARRAEHAAWAERFGRTMERDRELQRRRDARLTRPPDGG